MARGKFAKWLEKENLILLEGWARAGLADEQIAHNMGISPSTYYVWKEKYSEISEAIKKGKEVSDYEVESALFKSATGFKQTLRKPMKLKEEKQIQGKGKVVTERVEYVEEEIFIAPNTVAQIFWLKNRMPDKWRDKPVVAVQDEYDDDGLLAALDKQIDDLFSDGDDSDMVEQEE